jgi:Putative zinc-finger/Anti-sigma-K factor rskA
MTERDCQKTRELLEAYALGALEEDERAAVERHLETCADCRALAAELVETAHKLPLALGAVSPRRPPVALKARLLGQLAPEERVEARRWWWRPSAALALVGLVLAALFAAWDARLDDALSQERDLRARLARLQVQQELVLEVVDSRETRKAVLLPPKGSNSRAYGKVFTRADMPHVVAMAARLPQPRRDRAYHLWLTSAGRTELAGVLAIDSSGFGLILFEAARAGPVYEEARLIEQPKDSRRPRGEPVLRWRAEH